MPVTPPSDTYYLGDHAIVFELPDGSDSANTWTDWFLIPTSRPTMTLPSAQTKFVEIDGMNGSYDISDYLTSEMTYSDRTGSFEFIVDNNHTDWITIYETVRVFVNGRRLKMFLTDDPNWYYEGRFSVDEFKSDKENSKIVIGYRVSPFKISTYDDFVENVLWDPFNFEMDYDYSVFYHISPGNQTITYTFPLPISTTIKGKLISGSSVVVNLNGVSKTLNTVGNVVEIGSTISAGQNVITLSGNGVVDIGWRKYSL